eukprot:scaffold189655_cov31-Tisochrysis_lutea.AAC.4
MRTSTWLQWRLPPAACEEAPGRAHCFWSARFRASAPSVTTASWMISWSILRSRPSSSARRLASTARVDSSSLEVACSSRRRCSKRRGRASSHRLTFSARSRFNVTTYEYGTVVPSRPSASRPEYSTPSTIAAPDFSPSGLPLSPRRRRDRALESDRPSATPPLSPITLSPSATVCSVAPSLVKSLANSSALVSPNSLDERSSLISCSGAKRELLSFAEGGAPLTARPLPLLLLGRGVVPNDKLLAPQPSLAGSSSAPARAQPPWSPIPLEASTSSVNGNGAPIAFDAPRAT